MNPEQWLSLKWNGGSTMSDRWLNQSKIIQLQQNRTKVEEIRGGNQDIGIEVDVDLSLIHI